MSDRALNRLAKAVGLDVQWTDAFGATRKVAPETIRRVLGEQALRAQWRLADCSSWTIAANFGEDDVSLPDPSGAPTWATDAFASKAASGGTLVGPSLVLWHSEQTT